MTREEEKYTTLDTEQCKWWVNHLFNVAKEKACNNHNFDDAQEIQSAQDKIIKALEQEPILDKIRAEIIEEKDFAYADFEQYKVDCLGVDAEYAEDELPQDDFRYGMERAIEIIDKYKAERVDTE
jgi:hypothetical protein